MGVTGWTSAHPPVAKMAWMEKAVCAIDRADPKLFAELDGKATVADANRIAEAWTYCSKCPVILSCAQFGTRSRASGVYGGEILVEGMPTYVRNLIGKKTRVRIRKSHHKKKVIDE